MCSAGKEAGKARTLLLLSSPLAQPHLPPLLPAPAMTHWGPPQPACWPLHPSQTSGQCVAPYNWSQTATPHSCGPHPQHCLNYQRNAVTASGKPHNVSGFNSVINANIRLNSLPFSSYRAGHKCVCLQAEQVLSYERIDLLMIGSFIHSKTSGSSEPSASYKLLRLMPCPCGRQLWLRVSIPCYVSLLPPPLVSLRSSLVTE